MFNSHLTKSLLWLTLFFVTSLAAETAEISGHVFDRVSNEPLPGTNIKLSGTSIGVATTASGFFRITDLNAGVYYLELSRIGYAGEKKEIRLAANESLSLEVGLEARALEFDEVVVTALRERRLRSEVAVATQVIARSELDKRVVETVGEALENATGLFLRNYGGIGSLKTASMRGTDVRHILILLDGHRLNHAQGISPDLGDISLQAIERIEIVRGGHSAVYGADAVGGVVNLITKPLSGTKQISGGATTSFGSFGNRAVQANFNQNFGSFRYLVSHKLGESDGDFKFSNDLREVTTRTNNQFNYNDTFVKFEFSPSSVSSLQGFVNYRDAKRGAPGPLSFPSNEAEQKDKYWEYNLNYNQVFSNALQFHLQGFLNKFKQNYDDPNEFFPISSEHKNDMYGFNAQSSLRLSRSYSLLGGYEFRQDQLESTDVPDTSRSTHSAFLQNQIDVPMINDHTQLSLLPSVRMDKHKGLDTELSPKFGAVLKSASRVGISIRGSVGRSYGLPSLNDLFWPSGPFTAGNPNLKPERIVGYDFGLSVNIKANGFWGLELNYFDNQVEDLIIWQPRNDGVFMPQNVQDASIRGFETSFNVAGLLNVVDFKVNYTYMQPRDRTVGTDADLIYRPRHQFNVNFGLDVRANALGVSFQGIGKRFTNSANSNSLEASYYTNLYASRRLALGQLKVKVIAEVRNLFNEREQIIEGYPIPGREYRTSFGIEF